jgi:hypothetical protein
VSDAIPQDLGLMGKLVIGRAVSLIAAGVFWHGVTAQGFERFWNDLLNRPSGPTRSRFILQPSMAAIAAIKDARTSRSPHFWKIVDNPRGRMGRLREGLTTTARFTLLGLTMDVIYQFLVFNTFYPVEALIVALLLGFVPYLVIRGPVTRFARWRNGGAPGGLR